MDILQNMHILQAKLYVCLKDYFIVAHSLNNSLSVWPHTTIQTKHWKDEYEYTLDNLMLDYEWCIGIVRNTCLEPVTALMQSIKDQYKI